MDSPIDNSLEPDLFEETNVSPSSLDLLDAEETSMAYDERDDLMEDRNVVVNQEIEKKTVNSTSDTSSSNNLEFRIEPSNSLRVWSAKSGSNLKTILAKWCEQENVKLIWNEEKDYRLDYDVFISGTFDSAVEVLLSEGVKDSPSYKIGTNPYSLIVGGAE